MAISLTQLNADVAAMISDLPVEGTINGQTLNMTRAPLQRLDSLEIEGEREVYQFSLYGQASAFNTEPDIDHTLTITGDAETYLVVGKKFDDTKQLLRLDMAEQYGS